MNFLWRCCDIDIETSYTHKLYRKTKNMFSIY